MFDQLFGGLSSLGNSLSGMASDLSSGVSDFFSEDPEYDEETGQAKNTAAFEEQIAAAEAEGDMEYAQSLRNDLDKFEKSQNKERLTKLSDIGKVLDVSGDQKVLKGKQLQAPDLMNIGRARGFGDIARLPYRYDVAGEGSYQQSGALEDILSKSIQGLLSNAIRQNPYRRLI
jgi:hypothetical protein